jgi:hypothetical protein
MPHDRSPEVDRLFDQEMAETLGLAHERDKLKQDLVILLNQIDLNRLPYNFSYELTPAQYKGDWGYQLMLLSESRDPFTREKLTIQTPVGVFSKPPTLSRLSKKIRLTVHSFVTHEADEMIFVDGEQAFNPHANDPK